MHKETLAILAAVGAVLFLGRRSAAMQAVPTSAILPVDDGGPAGAVGDLAPIPGGGYRFPRLPSDQYFTTDPATGQVYVVEQGYGGAMPWVTTSDILRGRL